MKKISIIFVCISVLFSSCSTDFINILPIDTVTQDRYYQTDKDFADALTGVYVPIRNMYNNFWIYGDQRADDSWVQPAKSNSATYSDQFTMNSNEGQLQTTWTNYYQAIFRGNYLLTKIEPFNETTIPNKNRYVMETRFLRALCYFDLIRIFGPVPAVTSVLSISESYKTPRAPINDIYNIIIEDLKAAENLPASYSGADIGRPTRGAAKALLGRVYLTKGDFASAESKLLEVTNMGYALVENYNSIFDPATKRTKEYIFDIEYASGVSAGSNLTNICMPNHAGMQSLYGVPGTGNEWNNPTQALISLFVADDKRKDISIGTPGGFYDAAGNFVNLPSTTNQNYTKKYLFKIPAANDSPVNWHIVRYADVLLMLAEAMNENGKTAQAIPYLNAVRKRAGVEEYPTTMSKSETFAAIEKERRLELCFEGARWFDLVRWGKAYETMKDTGMAPYMTLFPVPLSQVQLINDPAIFSQNPGYDK